jgi:hypothetical protein
LRVEDVLPRGDIAWARAPSARVCANAVAGAGHHTNPRHAINRSVGVMERIIVR